MLHSTFPSCHQKFDKHGYAVLLCRLQAYCDLKLCNMSRLAITEHEQYSSADVQHTLHDGLVNKTLHCKWHACVQLQQALAGAGAA